MNACAVHDEMKKAAISIRALVNIISLCLAFKSDTAYWDKRSVRRGQSFRTMIATTTTLNFSQNIASSGHMLRTLRLGT